MTTLLKYKTHVACRGDLRARKPADAVVASLLLSVYEDDPGPIVVAVGGPGGTGKSTFSEQLAERLVDSTLLRLDDYRTPRAERTDRGLFGSHPDANRIDLLIEHLRSVRAQRPFEKPIYDAVSGRADRTEWIEPRRFVVLDGEVSTYRQFRGYVDFSVFIDSDWKTQLATRVSRDVDQRGFSREKSIQTFLQSNLRDFEAHGAESKNWADVLLFCHEDFQLVVESVATNLFSRFETLLCDDLAAVDISGLIVAVLTPFADDDSLARDKFVEHLEYMAARGVRRVLIAGTTGEFFSLTIEERRSLFMLARRYFPGVILQHVTRESLTETIEEAHWAQDHGADGVVVLPPYYLAGAPAKGVVEYFNRIFAEITTPLVLYNFPRHTQNALTRDMLASIRHFALKDSASELSLIGATPRYFVGGDARALEASRQGALGFISGAANVAPRLYAAFETALIERDADECDRLQAKVTEFVEAIPVEAQIPALKHALAKLLPGYPARVRLPLTAASARHALRAEAALSIARGG